LSIKTITSISKKNNLSLQV